jgi:hypothetical protein
MITQKELQQFLKNIKWTASERLGSLNSIFFSENNATLGLWNGKWVMKFPHPDSDADLAVVTSTARSVKILHSIDTGDIRYQHAFHIEGYRLKLIFTGKPSDEIIQSNVIYLYMNASCLEVAMINVSGMLQRISLDDMPNNETMQQDFIELTHQKEAPDCPAYISHRFAEHAHAIFKKANVSREALLMPYVGKESVHDREAVAKAVLNIYCKTGNIIINGCVPHTFLMHDQSDFCKEVLVDATSVYHRDAPESVAFFNRANVWHAHEQYWLVYNQIYPEDPVVAMIKTLFYIESQVKDHAVNTLIHAEMIPTLHVFCQKKWALNLQGLQAIKFILNRSQARKEVSPAITPEVIQALVHAWSEFDEKLSSVFATSISSSPSSALPLRPSEVSMFTSLHHINHDHVIGQKRPLNKQDKKEKTRQDGHEPGAFGYE